ncbi:MAG: hypothetical protein LAO78_24235 [Acidobacteriia bacterium]|nr:hypothetical protein [Terriglobia bacterium]
MTHKSMDPFARKMVFGSFVYGGVMLVMFAVLTVVYLHMRPRCSDRVVAAATDAGKAWTATVMERRCGAEAPFFTHVNIRSASEDLRTGFFSGASTEGEVFLIEQDAAGAGVNLIWIAPDTLAIACPHCTPAYIRQSDPQWGVVRIHYQLPPR